MTEPAFQPCETCGRVVLGRGALGQIEAAFDREGAHLVFAYFEGLALGNATAQEDLFDINERVTQFAETGQLEIPRELNDLGGGLWELKTSRSRYPFFYLEQPSCAWVRMTHGFKKATGMTVRGRTTFRDLDLANAIRREDLSR